MIKPSQVVNIVEGYRNDPIAFFRCQWADEKIWNKQIEIAESVVKNKRTYVRACHSSSKTHTAGRLAIWWLSVYKPSIVITTAPTYMQVQMLLWGQVRGAYQKAKYNLGGKILPTSPEWKISDDHYALGLSVREPDRLQGHHTPTGRVLVIIDEGSGVPDIIWDGIESLLTSENSRLLVIGNPLRNTGKFSQVFKTGSEGRIHISGLDAVKYHNEIPGLISQSYIDEQKEEYDKGNNPMYLPRVLGEEPQVSLDSIISPINIDRAINRVLEYDKVTHISIDWGAGGLGKSIFIAWARGKQIEIEKLIRKEPAETVGRAIIFINKYKSKDLKFVIHDVCGIGKVYGDLLNESLKKIVKIIPFNSGEPSADAQFQNVRAESWFNFKALLDDEIQLLDDDEQKQQLVMVNWFTNSRGKILVTSKDDLISDYGVSPDIADSAVMGGYGLRYLAQIDRFRVLSEEDIEQLRERKKDRAMSGASSSKYGTYIILIGLLGLLL